MAFYFITGITPLWFAAYNDNIEMVRLLLDKGANAEALGK
eukprot:gene39334-53176_t